MGWAALLFGPANPRPLGARLPPFITGPLLLLNPLSPTWGAGVLPYSIIGPLALSLWDSDAGKLASLGAAFEINPQREVDLKVAAFILGLCSDLALGKLLMTSVHPSVKCD